MSKRLPEIMQVTLMWRCNEEELDEPCTYAGTTLGFGEKGDTCGWYRIKEEAVDVRFGDSYE